jgi:hypothetical protein
VCNTESSALQMRISLFARVSNPTAQAICTL